MREQILEFWRQKPFVPFVVYVDTGTAYSIPTSEHFHPAKKLLFVFDDDGLANTIPYEYIRQLTFRDLHSA